MLKSSSGSTGTVFSTQSPIPRPKPPATPIPSSCIQWEKERAEKAAMQKTTKWKVKKVLTYAVSLLVFVGCPIALVVLCLLGLEKYFIYALMTVLVVTALVCLVGLSIELAKEVLGDF